MDLDGFDNASTVANVQLKSQLAQDALRYLDLKWYTQVSRRGRWMDLIGDYAGDEMFLIDGEAIFQEVLDDPLLAIGRDNDPSFQTLHAIYSLEKILESFRSRSATFEIGFWEDGRHATLRTGSSIFENSSRVLARVVLFKHLQKLDIPIRTFENMSDQKWFNYRQSKKPMFIMTNDGGILQDTSSSFAAERILIQRIFIFDMLSQGVSVSLLRGAEYRDSKILSFVFEQRWDTTARSRMGKKLWTVCDATMQSLEVQESRAQRGLLVPPLSAFSSQGLQSFDNKMNSLAEFVRHMNNKASSHPHRTALIFAFVAHLLITPSLSVAQRARRLDTLDTKLNVYLVSNFFPTAFQILAKALQETDLDIDGRVFVALLGYLSANQSRTLEELLGKEMSSQVKHACRSLDDSLVTLEWPSIQPAPASSVATLTELRALLPFAHPVFDNELVSVKVDVDVTAQSDPPLRLDYNTVFNDRFHWHNNRSSILPPHLGGEVTGPMTQWQLMRKLRSDQRFMANMEFQAKTLTGAFGVALDRMVILLAGSRPTVKKAETRTIQPKPMKSGKKNKNDHVSSADKIRQANAAKKQSQQDDLNQDWWTEQMSKCESKPIVTQISFMDGLLRNKRTSEGWLAAEFHLYRLNLELKQWIEHPSREDAVTRDNTVVSILRMVKDTYQQQSIFPSVIEHLDTVLDVVGLDSVKPDLKAQLPADISVDRKLNFKFVKLVKSKTRSLLYKFMNIGEDPIVWQLRMFGEYMDRSMDSESDRRVSFKPDAWQRRVLDCLDDNQSVLVVAPTSAGKTFISYYAMEQTLRNSDDGVLVYVAPTKALVNQIAAEVYARFSKSLKGRSCWAIHTRDYRVHNPQTCQILVTVPEMLAIMLLSPPLARVWTPRIKRIILDEIHSIGQQEGGAVWEQIVLLAPCPIIGLSATIGHPDKFNDWLRSVQEAHGFKHTFIHHAHRYSHLRKFSYSLQTSPSRGFTGLANYTATGRMRFMHPISLLVFGARELPPDFSLEASDCLSLYRALSSHQDEILLDFKALEPSAFFSNSAVRLLRQQDVLRYENALKDTMSELLASFDPQDPTTVTNAIVRDLTDPGLRSSDAQFVPDVKAFYSNLIFLVSDLHHNGDLPAILFNFDRKACETMAEGLLAALEKSEKEWREKSSEWTNKIQQWERWQAQAKIRERQASREVRQKKNDEEQVSEIDSSWERHFNPKDPSPQFTFAGKASAYSLGDLNKEISQLKRWVPTPNWIWNALRRGIGIHHAGMNKRYRSLVESLYRMGFIRILIATGTLALGINAPTRTSVFCGDSPYLTALMYRQCAGRAGRRGYDLLGKVLFYGIAMDRCQRLVLSRLPSLGGNFPLTTTMVLRLLNLLQGSDNAPVAVHAIKSLLRLPQITIASEFGRDQILHFMRFSVEYLRRAALLDEQGNPINLFGIAAHLFYTEPGNLALVVLLRQGVIHDICSQSSTVDACRDLVLLLCHLFGRRYLPKPYVIDENLQAIVKKSPSMVVLPPLPPKAKRVLQQHNVMIQEIFAGYASAYATQHSEKLGPDTQLPLGSKFDNQVDDALCHELDRFFSAKAIPVEIRSSFVANSGHSDSFASTEELSRTVRRGIHLNEHAIPSMESFISDTDAASGNHGHVLNAYLLDFYIHGQPAALKAANGIRDNDLWYLLQDFTLTLKTIREGLGQLLLNTAQTKQGDEDELEELDSGYGTLNVDEDDEEAGSDDGIQSTGIQRPPGVLDSDWRVYEILTCVTEEFDTKYRAIWA